MGNGYVFKTNQYVVQQMIRSNLQNTYGTVERPFLRMKACLMTKIFVTTSGISMKSLPNRSVSYSFCIDELRIYENIFMAM